MDPPAAAEKEKDSQSNAWLGRGAGLFLSLIVLLLLTLLIGFVAVFIDHSWISNPISVLSRCKIVSSSVDLRSSKVCELGLLNYKAKHVFYPFEKRKFRCHHDYYWASVFKKLRWWEHHKSTGIMYFHHPETPSAFSFGTNCPAQPTQMEKVEYKDHSGQMQVAFAEAPNEALPVDCRPNFGVAWLTKDKFKVNETYDCWYTFGLSKVNIYHNSYFNCQPKDPSTAEMLKRSPRILKSWFASRGRDWYWKWEMVAGLVTGFSTSLISLSLIAVVQQVKSRLLLTYLKQACLVVAYFSFVGWLAFQYVKKLGLPKIFMQN
ncbi:uncharacterized protein LOC127786711 isoform X2 [Diospyros lotus]|uniref:uncharacterized protein LOC127786711 isoform X2 n=1 Tax=Diospyros lotus TaxID=55363 RepID=UPI0022596161|nr:uncharacterized protein LOC127786711 isoform X2 [Diospyros lotus]